MKLWMQDVLLIEYRLTFLLLKKKVVTVSSFSATSHSPLSSLLLLRFVLFFTNKQDSSCVSFSFWAVRLLVVVF